MTVEDIGALRQYPQQTRQYIPLRFTPFNL